MTDDMAKIAEFMAAFLKFVFLVVTLPVWIIPFLVYRYWYQG